MREERKKPQPARASADGESRVRDEGERLESEADAAQLGLLRRQYRSLTGKPVHPSVPRFLLARAVAYERQVREHGDLSARVISALAAVANQELGRPGEPPAGPAPSRVVPMIRPGTILVREHQNVLHRVTALESGFSWNGKTFASLSAVARAITGVRWNGPRFFGLQAKSLGHVSEGSKERPRAGP
ncbi:MAG: hypothetical protein QOC72_2529 [Methylobacteriaceae bacterium]|jgi:hypothetical protein|nr:hypothetical protein [Methylobacteriaceae bacterium]